MTRLYTELRYGSDAEWREARKGGIGGSDVGAIMGLSNWTSPLEVWLVKTGREEPADLSGKESVKWGNVLEPVVAGEFASRHPEMKVLRKNCTMVSKERPWAFANIDRELRGPDGRGILEIKTAGLRSADQWVFGPPDHYLCQVQHYLSVTGWDFAWCAVLIGGQEYREYFIPRDEDDIAAIDAAVDKFWNEYVVTGVMPEMTGRGNEGRALAGLHLENNGEYVSVMDADFPELGEAVSLNQEIKALQARKREVDNAIKARVGDAKGIESESVRCTWSRFKEARLDSKRLKAERPEIFAEYSNESVKDGGLRLSPSKS